MTLHNIFNSSDALRIKKPSLGESRPNFDIFGTKIRSGFYPD